MLLYTTLRNEYILNTLHQLGKIQTIINDAVLDLIGDFVKDKKCHVVQHICQDCTSQCFGILHSHVIGWSLG